MPRVQLAAECLVYIIAQDVADQQEMPMCFCVLTSPSKPAHRWHVRSSSGSRTLLDWTKWLLSMQAKQGSAGPFQQWSIKLISYPHIMSACLPAHLPVFHFLAFHGSLALFWADTACINSCDAHTQLIVGRTLLPSPWLRQIPLFSRRYFVSLTCLLFTGFNFYCKTNGILSCRPCLAGT